MIKPDNTMYELENAITADSNYCEYCIRRANGKLDNEISEIVYYLTENYDKKPDIVSKTITEKIDTFFKSVIASLKRFAADVQRKVEQAVRSKVEKYQFRYLAKNIAKLKNQGVEYIEMADVWTLEKKSNEYYNDLYSLGKKIIKNKYHNLDKMDQDFRSFDATCSNYIDELNKLMEDKIKVPIDKAAHWVDSEIRGKTSTLTSLTNYINQLEDLEAEVVRMEDLRNIHGADILPQKVGVIRRIINKLSQIIHNTVGKIVPKAIAVVVAVFA